MPNISIIVPVYNVSRYLKRCLDSLSFLLQKNNEMIIVNDGSTDGSLLIAEEFANINPGVSIVTQINAGLSAARNTGIQYAKGDYLWFVDSDDYIDENQFSPVWNALISQEYDVIVFGRMDDCLGKSKRNVALKDAEYSSGVDYFSLSISKDVYRTNAWDKIFRKSIIVDNNIDFIEGRLYEDMLFCQNVFSKAGKVKQCDAHPYIYNLSNVGSITKQVREKDLDVLWYIEILKKEFFDTTEIERFGEKSLNQLVFNWVNSCLLKKYIPMVGNNKEAKAIVDKVFENYVFMNSVRYCAFHRVLARQKAMAWMILFFPSIYCRLVSRFSA